ncbi:MAG: Flp family type IVb pilin [Deltaproteobacteria bacterium]|nr:MAG: Flp family type IVb pilin [Deltaproteobacteria bacterium]
MFPFRGVLWARFVEDECGGPAIEYMILASLIAMTILVGFTTMTDKVASTYSTVSASLPG